MAMVILKVRKSRNNIRSMPLFRALLLDGTIYYAVFILAFSLDIIASANSKVGVLHLYPNNGRLPLDIALLSHSGHPVCSVTLRFHYILTTPTVLYSVQT